MRVFLLFIILSTVASLGIGLVLRWPGRGQGAPGPVTTARWWAILSLLATFSVELGFYFDSDILGRRIDSGWILFHLSCMVPLLAINLVLIARCHWQEARGQAPGPQARYAWLVPVAITVPLLRVAFSSPLDRDANTVILLWYAVNYCLVLALLARAARFGMPSQGPADTKMRLLLGFFALCVAAEAAVPWNDGLKAALSGFPLWTPGLLATGLAMVLASRRATMIAPGNGAAPPLADAGGRFSPREQEVLALLRRGKTNQEIADLLFVSLPTVKKHVTNLYAKAGCRNRVELVSQLKNQG